MPVLSPVETEAKIRVPHLTAVRRRLLAAGGRLGTVRTLETNTLFDLPNRFLASRGHSFRVRQYGSQGSVTLKGPARVSGGLKTRVEMETPVGSPEILTQILLALGFVPQFRYEKFRELWVLGAVVVCLDDTPLGRFVEIEGTAAAIHEAANQLGLSPNRFLSASYPGLWIAEGRVGDMLFEGRKKRGTAGGRPKQKSKARA